MANAQPPRDRSSPRLRRGRAWPEHARRKRNTTWQLSANGETSSMHRLAMPRCSCGPPPGSSRKAWLAHRNPGCMPTLSITWHAKAVRGHGPRRGDPEPHPRGRAALGREPCGSCEASNIARNEHCKLFRTAPPAYLCAAPPASCYSRCSRSPSTAEEAGAAPDHGLRHKPTGQEGGSPGTSARHGSAGAGGGHRWTGDG